MKEERLVKNCKKRNFITAFFSIAMVFVLILIGKTETRADQGSYINITLTHDYTTCEGCHGVNTNQKVLTGTTHTFTLENVPEELKDCKVTWEMQGAEPDVGQIIEATDSYAKVTFTKRSESEFMSSCINVSLDVSNVYPGKFVFADYWMKVCDAFYTYPDGKYAVVNIGEQKTLTCDTFRCDAQNPTGANVTLTDAAWTASPWPLNKNTSGLSVSDAGVISASASGSYIVTGYASTGEQACYYTVLVPQGSVQVGQTVTAPSGTEAVYTFKPTVSGDYTFVDGMDVTLCDGSAAMEGERKSDDVVYTLTAGKNYYLYLYNGSIDMEMNCTIQAPASSGNQNPDQNQNPEQSQTKPKKGTILTSGKVSYKVTKTGSTVEYQKTTSTAKTVKIPATVKIDGITYKVTSIASNVFKSNQKITEVTIGKNVTTIGANAFSGCKKLKKVTIGAGVTTIGNSAFKNCTVLTSIKIPNKVTSIGTSAFSGCKKLKTVTVGTGLKKIGKQAFNGCSVLSTVTIKSTTLSSVGANAFKGIKANAKIKVPSKKLADYKKLLKGKGQGSKVTITKI